MNKLFYSQLEKYITGSTEMSKIKQITPEQCALILHLLRILLHEYIMFPEYIQEHQINKDMFLGHQNIYPKKSTHLKNFMHRPVP